MVDLLSASIFGFEFSFEFVFSCLYENVFVKVILAGTPCASSWACLPVERRPFSQMMIKERKASRSQLALVPLLSCDNTTEPIDCRFHTSKQKKKK